MNHRWIHHQPELIERNRFLGRANTTFLVFLSRLEVNDLFNRAQITFQNLFLNETQCALELTYDSDHICLKQRKLQAIEALAVHGLEESLSKSISIDIANLNDGTIDIHS